MAEQAVNFVASAVTSELTNRVFSGLIQRYGKDAATREKLQRLEMLLIKIHSAIEASEMRTIGNSWLLQWREKLKEAVSQGDEVLASFPQLATDAQGTTNTNNSNHQQCKAVSSSPAPSGDVGLSFTRNSVSNMVQGICSAKKMLFLSIDDDMERLNKTLGSLEKLSLDIGEFIRLLHLEALLKVDQTAYGTAPSTKVHGPMEKMGEKREKERMKISTTHSNPSSPLKDEKTEETSEDMLWSEESDSDSDELTLFCDSDSAVSPKQQHLMLLQDRLDEALAEICMAVELADGHDLEDLEWLAYWAGVLREAKEQGRHVLGTTSACKTFNREDNKEPAVECDQEEDELGSFVHRLEGLARDVEYFSKLVYLCPAR